MYSLLCQIADLCVRKFVQKKEMPALFKSAFEHKRVELKEKIKVTDVLLRELSKRNILLRQNNVDIMVRSYVVEIYKFCLYVNLHVLSLRHRLLYCQATKHHCRHFIFVITKLYSDSFFSHLYVNKFPVMSMFHVLKLKAENQLKF